MLNLRIGCSGFLLYLFGFEVQFDENRSFFSEGTELFNKSNLFYSRRIGDKPSSAISLSENEILVESPSRVQMLNASKISGRTAKGLGIGFFNAITEKTYATVEDTISGETSEKLIEPLIFIFFWWHGPSVPIVFGSFYILGGVLAPTSCPVPKCTTSALYACQASTCACVRIV